MRAEHHPTSELSAIRVDSSNAIDEDLYCLTCGYNLRGLPCIDPARCPECGEMNPLGDILIPAEWIRGALRAMETSPTMCVACAVFFACVAPWILINPRSVWPVVSILSTISLLAWLSFCARMRFVFADKPGWGKVLRDFHLAMLMWLLPVPVAITMMATGVPAPTAGFAFLLFAVLCIPALGRYRKAQARIGTMQREAAVRIASASLRKVLHRGKKRRRTN